MVRLFLRGEAAAQVVVDFPAGLPGGDGAVPAVLWASGPGFDELMGRVRMSRPDLAGIGGFLAEAAVAEAVGAAAGAGAGGGARRARGGGVPGRGPRRRGAVGRRAGVGHDPIGAAAGGGPVRRRARRGVPDSGYPGYGLFGAAGRDLDLPLLWRVVNPPAWSRLTRVAGRGQARPGPGPAPVGG